MDKKELTDRIKQKSAVEGFYACGVAPVHFLAEDKSYFESWLVASRHGSMSYLERNRAARYDPQQLLAGARSVISVLLSYRSGFAPVQKEVRISKYAYGADYHQRINNKLKNLVRFINEICPDEKAIANVDSAPVFEKRWAQQAGLGWRGKHTILINKNAGSFFFLGEIITTLELEYDHPENDYCGSCAKCIEACPTGALSGPYQLDARKCIAYLTIENEHEFDENTPPDFRNFIFGCDICQDICPWNKNSSAPVLQENEINKELLNKTADEWLNLTEEEFKILTKNSCIKRTGLAGIQRNVRHIHQK